MAGDSKLYTNFYRKEIKNTQQKFKKMYNLLDRNYKHRNNTILLKKNKNSEFFIAKVTLFQNSE